MKILFILNFFVGFMASEIPRVSVLVNNIIIILYINNILLLLLLLLLLILYDYYFIYIYIYIYIYIIKYLTFV